MGRHTLTTEEFSQLCDSLWPKGRWGSKVAKVLGCSAGHISHVRNGKAILSPAFALILLDYAEIHGGKVKHGAPANQRPGKSMSVSKVTDVGFKDKRTDNEIKAEQDEKFEEFEDMVDAVFDGALPSLIVSGNGGMGKTYTIAKVAKRKDVKVEFISGTASAPGVFQALWAVREGGIIVFDDCDAVFGNEEPLNLFKTALDSTDKRIVTYAKNAPWITNEGMEKSFEFKGSIIFVTNYDFEAMAESNNKMAPHFEALLNRSLYIDTTMKSRRELVIRVESMIDAVLVSAYEDGIINSRFTKAETKELMTFLKGHAENFRQLSLRTVVNVARLYKGVNNWEKKVKLTMMKSKRR